MINNLLTDSQVCSTGYIGLIVNTCNNNVTLTEVTTTVGVSSYSPTTSCKSSGVVGV